MIYDDILQCVGNTPVVRLNKLGKELAPVQLYGKCEFLNPGGSVKDRIAVRMVEGLEQAGKIGPGSTLIEATSGNTGTGLAMVAAVKDYPLIITMPIKMSKEKQVVMEALGAEIIRTRTEAGHDDQDSLFGVAKKKHAEIRQFRHSRPVRQSRQSGRPLLRHRPGDLGRLRRRARHDRADRRHRRHPDRHRPLPQGEEPQDPW